MGLFSGGAVEDFFDARKILAMQHMEVDRFRPAGGVEANRK